MTKKPNISRKVFMLLHEDRFVLVHVSGTHPFDSFEAADCFIKDIGYEHVPLNSFQAALIRDSYRKKGWRV